MSVCLELSSSLSNSANSSTESTELTPKEEQRDVLPVVPSQNVAKLVLANNANTMLQKVSTSSVITVVNATGPLTILKSCGTSPSQFSLVNSTPLSVCNAICKPITVVGAPPITVVRAVSNINPISKENGSNPADLVMSNSQSLNGLTSERLPIHNVFVKNTALSSELITGLNEVQKLVPSGASFVQSNIIQNVTSGATKVANGQKATSAATAGIVSNNTKLKILNNIVVTSASSMSSTNTATNNSNIVVNKSVAPKQYVQQKSINNSLNGTSKFNKNNCSTINNNFSRGGARTVCGSMPNQMQRLYPTHKSQIRTLPPVGNSGSKTGIKTLSPQFRGASSTNPQVSKNASKLRSVHSQQRLSKMSNKPNYIGKHAIQAQKFKGSHLPGGRLKNNGKPSIMSSAGGGGSQRTPPNAGSVYHQVLTANIIQTLGENGGNSIQEYDEIMPNYGQAGYNESARSMGYSDLSGSMASKPNYALDALSEVCKAILLDHNYNAAPPSESPVRNTLLTTIQTQLNGATPGSYYSPTNSNRSRVPLGTLINTPSTLSSISNSSILQSNTGSSFLQDDDAASDISCGSERKMETEGEETDTAPEAEAVTQEGYNYNDHYGDYVTRCICGFLHDDGYMIECDKCKVWQHVRCVIKLNKKVPQDYLCEECDSSKTVDRIKARALQQQWMRENQERDAKIIRKETRIHELKSKDALSDSDSSEGEQIGLKIANKNRVTTIARRKAEQLQKHSFRHRRDTSKLDIHKRPIKRKDRKINKKKTKIASKTPSDDDNNHQHHQDVWQNTTVSQIPQLRQWIENYEEAVTNHYSPELRARISSIRSNGVHSELLSQVDNTVHSCRVHTQPLTGLKYLVSTEILESNVPVIELRGKYMLSTQHRGGSGHGNILSTRQHSQRPGPFLFFYRLHKDNTEVCVDTRTYGNDARFVRRSCTPNSELKHCIEKGVLHLYIVTISAVDKNMELTIKHESHDLAATGSTSIACACDRQEECALNKSSIKKNGDSTADGYSLALRKRRGRRTVSSCTYDNQDAAVVVPKVKEEPPEVQEEVKEEVNNIKVDIDIQLDQIKVEEDIKEIIKEESATVNPLENLIIKEEENVTTRTDLCSPTPSLCMSNCIKKTPSKSDSEDKKESPSKELSTSAADKKKMSREERKIEAYMKAFERMERQQLKRQEHQAKQAHRRESEPGPNGKDEDKLELKGKRRKRKGRARTVSTNSQVRRNRLNSADSSYATSGEECLLSPIATESILSRTSTRDEISSTKNAELLLTLSTNSNHTEVGSPVRDVDCNSNSANSSPETPLSSACLLVAAAVEPLERNFKFPKTKKILMNEWLNQSADCVQSASSISPSSLNPHFISPPESNFYETTSNGNFYGTKIVQVNNSYCEAPSQAHGNAKKRWLRQAISEDRCDSPNATRPESPPIPEMVAPPKKRRLPRETLSNDAVPANNIIVNSEDTSHVAANEESSKPFNEQEDRVEIVTAGADGDSPTSVLIDDAMLKERVAEMQQEIGSCFRLPETREILSKESSLRCNLDPRLTRTMFNNSDHLVATVEKNLCILGFEDQKQDVTAPTKRKLSITEYRQRKKQTCETDKETVDDSVNDDNGASRSPVPQKLRLRSDSVSSTASFVSSDEEEVGVTELPAKTLSAFNSEPTELEKQRENVSLRLKKAFGLSVDDENRKTVSTMGALMNCDLDSSRENLSTLNYDRSSLDSELVEQKFEGDLNDCKSVERVAGVKDNVEIDVAPPMEDVKPEMFYTPDEEDVDKEEELDKVKNTAELDVECTNYVPPFNNPVYPNSNFPTFGSVIDDDAPYEGRNPSPPPELSNVTSSYSSSP